MVSRIRELCKENGTSIAKLEKQLGFGNGIIARWNKSVPNYERISAVAEALGTTVKYLQTGETDEKKAPPAISEERSADMERAMSILSSFSPAELALAVERLEKIAEK